MKLTSNYSPLASAMLPGHTITCQTNSQALHLKKNSVALLQTIPRSNKLEYVTTHDSVNPCLFICADCVVVFYVDNSIVVGHNKLTAESLISQLEANGLDLTCKGTLAHYLGVQINHDNSRDLVLTQSGITQQILDALGLGNSHTKSTPASGPLGDCENGAFNYRSLVGMLLYLGNATQPDCFLTIH